MQANQEQQHGQMIPIPLATTVAFFRDIAIMVFVVVYCIHTL